jgi:hypothetical protein
VWSPLPLRPRSVPGPARLVREALKVDRWRASESMLSSGDIRMLLDELSEELEISRRRRGDGARL